MKILYFLAHPDSMGGAIKVLLTQAYNTRRNGNKVKVVIQNNNENTHIPEFEELCGQYKLEYVSAQYPIATCIENIDILNCTDKYEVVKKIVTDFLPDLIHSLQLNSVVEYVAREMNIPHLMNIYQISEGMFNIKWLDIFPKYHCGDSFYYCKKWQVGLGIESRCIRVEYDKDKIEKTKKNKLPHNRIEIINIAVVTQHKRQLEIIKFVEKCRDNGFSVHIRFLGNDKSDYAKICKEYVESHGLNNIVTFEGLVLGVEKYLRMSELMVHASTCESYPGVIVEAMGNRIPVLATPVAGVPELLHDEVNGFLTKGYSATDLYEAFERYVVLKNDGKIDSIISNAYDTYLSNHTFDAIAHELGEYYQSIISNHVKSENPFLEIKSSFEKILQFGEEINVGIYSNETRSRLWFLYHIRQVIDSRSYSTAVIWGAGFHGRIALEYCKILSLKVVGIFDKLKTGLFEGIEISRPNAEMIKNADVLFLAMTDIEACEENVNIIENAGKIRNINYFLTNNDPCIQAEWLIND